MSTYMQGIKDAIEYLGGSTFQLSEAPTVESCLALLRAFEAQGGYTRWHAPEESAIPEGCTPADAMVLREANHHFADENQALRRCLRWYANGEHIVGFPTWEGPSGDDNWLCPPMADFGDYRQKFIDTLDEHMVEDGAVARGTLRSGKFEVESPEDEPKVIEGEPEWHVEQQAHSSPPLARDLELWERHAKACALTCLRDDCKLQCQRHLPQRMP